jgi:hypothetical protein
MLSKLKYAVLYFLIAYAIDTVSGILLTVMNHKGDLLKLGLVWIIAAILIYLTFLVATHRPAINLEKIH